jgi:hypothetical protein
MSIRRIIVVFLLLLVPCVMAQPQNTSSILTVSLCELTRHPSRYDGKQIRTRALFHSGFEWSTLDDVACKKRPVWVDFSNSVEENTQPETYRRFEEAAYHDIYNERGEIMDEWLDWQVELEVIGTFYKPNKQGYGHTNIYRYKVVVTSIEKVGAAKRVDLLAKGKSN